MGQVRHGCATHCHLAVVCVANHERARTPSEQQYSDPLPGRVMRSMIPRGGFFRMDIADLQTAEAKLSLVVAIDRTSKFAVTQLVEKADRKTAWEVLEHLLEAVPQDPAPLSGHFVPKCPAGQWTTASSSPSSLGTGIQRIHGKCAST
jgi:hypothetical protein